MAERWRDDLNAMVDAEALDAQRVTAKPVEVGLSADMEAKCSPSALRRRSWLGARTPDRADRLYDQSQ